MFRPFKLPKAATAIGAALALTGAAGSIAVAGNSDAQVDRQAATEASRADNDLRHAHAASAVGHAERAVQLRPQVASYRVLLGQSYMKAGRFASARDALADALVLDPNNGRVALNLALSQVAIGDWEHARQTLTAHQNAIPAADRGLAVSLAGDPVGGIAILMDAVRAPDADAKTRQNLALSLALAGRWQEARAVAAVDVSPDQIDNRLQQWALFATPHSASDQVATLLGVRAVLDGGQPAALALSATASPQVAAESAATVDAFMPGQAAGAAVAVQDVPAAAPVVQNVPAPEAAAVAPSTVAQVVFGPRREVVQPLPAQDVAPVRVASARQPRVAPVRAAVALASPARAGAPDYAVAEPASGNWYVQVGAYQNAAVARDAWRRIRTGNLSLGSHQPQGAWVSTAGTTFYRLSVGGFSHDGASQLCASYRQQGGRCFVRAAAGDRIVSWGGAARSTVALASR